VSRWVSTTQPAAQLTPETPEPIQHEDGSQVQVFSTAFGKRFARVTEKSGLTYWLREIETA
jgi:hypothetical protein